MELDVVVWREAPETWIQAAHEWLQAQTSEHTRRSYETALRQFLAYRLRRNGEGAVIEDIAGAQLWRVTASDLRGWQRALQEKAAAKTVATRLLAVRSFFSFCTRQVAFVDQAREVNRPLLQHNPLLEAVKPAPVAATPRVALSVEQVRALVGACDRTKVAGLRDYALIVGYLLTGHRNSELRRLRWGDIHIDGDDVLVFWQGKGGRSGQEFLHPVVYAALRAYLAAVGRTLTADDYIFTPLTDSARRFPHVEQPDMSRPLSRQRVNAIIKQRARAAGIDPRFVTTHTLRRTAARRFFEVSGHDLDETAKMLHHASVATTRVYLNQPERASRDIWAEVAALYGL